MFWTRKRALVVIEVSAGVYDSLALAMVAGGANIVLTDGALDMRDVGLVRAAAEPPAPPKHRPISTNKAPGAI